MSFPCNLGLPHRYIGGTHDYFSVSLQQMIDAGVRIYYHVDWHRCRDHFFNVPELEEQKWRLLRKESDLPESEVKEARINGRDCCVESSVSISFRIPPNIYARVKEVEAENKRRGEEYWRQYRESGQADRDAEARGRFWTRYLKGSRVSEQYIHDHDIAPEAAI